jgi:hypothetical protein
MKMSKTYQITQKNQIVITNIYPTTLVDVEQIVELIHICADESKILTNGEIKCRCVNTLNPSEWYEIDAPVYDDID